MLLTCLGDESTGRLLGFVSVAPAGAAAPEVYRGMVHEVPDGSADDAIGAPRLVLWLFEMFFFTAKKVGNKK